jgi:hypothetical protein
VSVPGITARVSRFLYDPDAPSDEIRRPAERLDVLVQSAREPPRASRRILDATVASRRSAMRRARPS